MTSKHGFAATLTLGRKTDVDNTILIKTLVFGLSNDVGNLTL